MVRFRSGCFGVWTITRRDPVIAVVRQSMDEFGAQVKMSNVTNVIVSVWGGRRQSDLLKPFTVPDNSRLWRGCLSSITEGDAGNLWVHDGKGPECHVWVGAFNHMNRQSFLADIENYPGAIHSAFKSSSWVKMMNALDCGCSSKDACEKYRYRVSSDRD